MDKLAAIYLWYGIPPTARNSFDAVVKPYAALAAQHNWEGPLFPAPAHRVGTWIAHEAHKLVESGAPLVPTVLPAKIESLARWHTELGFDDTGVRSPLVRAVAAGALVVHTPPTPA